MAVGLDLDRPVREGVRANRAGNICGVARGHVDLTAPARRPTWWRGRESAWLPRPAERSWCCVLMCLAEVDRLFGFDWMPWAPQPCA